jgi:glucose-fructose oxidoreductase
LGFATLAWPDYSPLQPLPNGTPCRIGSADAGKANFVANQHKLPSDSVYSADFDRIAKDPPLDVVYIVLPNCPHAE